MGLGKQLGKSAGKTATFTLVLVFIVVFIDIIYDNGYLTALHIAPFTINELVRFMLMFGYLVWFVFLFFLDG